MTPSATCAHVHLLSLLPRVLLLPLNLIQRLNVISFCVRPTLPLPPSFYRCLLQGASPTSPPVLASATLDTSLRLNVTYAGSDIHLQYIRSCSDSDAHIINFPANVTVSLQLFDRRVSLACPGYFILPTRLAGLSTSDSPTRFSDEIFIIATGLNATYISLDFFGSISMIAALRARHLANAGPFTYLHPELSTASSPFTSHSTSNVTAVSQFSNSAPTLTPNFPTFHDADQLLIKPFLHSTLSTSSNALYTHLESALLRALPTDFSPSSLQSVYNSHLYHNCVLTLHEFSPTPGPTPITSASTLLTFAVDLQCTYNVLDSDTLAAFVSTTPHSLNVLPPLSYSQPIRLMGPNSAATCIGRVIVSITPTPNSTPILTEFYVLPDAVNTIAGSSVLGLEILSGYFSGYPTFPPPSTVLPTSATPTDSIQHLLLSPTANDDPTIEPTRALIPTVNLLISFSTVSPNSSAVSAIVDNGAAFPAISSSFVSSHDIVPILVTSDMPSFYQGYERIAFTPSTFTYLNVQLPHSDRFARLPFFISDHPNCPDIILPSFLLPNDHILHLLADATPTSPSSSSAPFITDLSYSPFRSPPRAPTNLILQRAPILSQPRAPLPQPHSSARIHSRLVLLLPLSHLRDPTLSQPQLQFHHRGLSLSLHLHVALHLLLLLPLLLSALKFHPSLLLLHNCIHLPTLILLLILQSATSWSHLFSVAPQLPHQIAASTVSSSLLLLTVVLAPISSILVCLNFFLQPHSQRPVNPVMSSSSPLIKRKFAFQLPSP